MSFYKKPKSKEIEEFINEPISGSNKYHEQYAWQSYEKHEKVKKICTFRTNRYYTSAIDALSKKLGKSKQQFIDDIIKKEVDKLIKKLM